MPAVARISSGCISTEYTGSGLPFSIPPPCQSSSGVAIVTNSSTALDVADNDDDVAAAAADDDDDDDDDAPAANDEDDEAIVRPLYTQEIVLLGKLLSSTESDDKLQCEISSVLLLRRQRHKGHIFQFQSFKMHHKVHHLNKWLREF